MPNKLTLELAVGRGVGLFVVGLSVLRLFGVGFKVVDDIEVAWNVGMMVGYREVGKLVAAGEGIVGEGLICAGSSLFPSTTIETTAIDPITHAMISTIPKHNHLPPGVRVSGKQVLTSAISL